ncbi:WD domain, G-beta repeat [Musa troglodytarum]|uniref:WD domain, G-beta repeat n=1 Tax=Musa troglodytarum TaxID=320322 RepID=A0A9E7I4L1_9LILI|nr:WD domain, G-beta repeat [Musa troglodytarum]
MASPLMRLRDREWYSPASNELAYPGDRFIPTRSLMNLDFARSSLTERRRRAPAAIDSPVILTPKDEYRRRVEENMRLDSEGKPRKMLVFRGSPRNSKPSVLLVDEMMKDQQERLRPTDRIRHVPKSADRILDGTALLDDYYLNLMDWGKKNILAVALGRSVYLWNATNNSVQLLLTADEDDHPTSVAWSVDAKTVAVGFAGSRVEIWDAVELQQVRILEGHSGRVGSLSWNQNVLTSGSHDASIINHDVRSSHHLASRLKAHSEEVCGLKWSGGGNLLASGGNDNLVHVWESSKMGSSRHEKEILSAHGYGQNQLSLWAYPSMTKIGDLTGHTARVLHLSQRNPRAPLRPFESTPSLPLLCSPPRDPNLCSLPLPLPRYLPSWSCEMASPLMRLRDREWYSPASNELAYPGDRFIPTRSLMNLDFARSSLTERRRRAPAAIDSPVILTPKDEYRRRVEENMRLDSEGKPRKMLVFRGSPRNSKPSVLLVDEMMKDQQERLRPTDRIRHVPKSADRILDGTALLDDYYLNLMDWGKKNILAVALGRSVYLWNATNNSVQLLLTADEDDHPTSVAWSVDAKTVAVGFAGSRVEIWDAVELQQVRILEGHSGRVGSLSWNQNVLTSGSHDASIINHDVRSSHHLASRLKAHSEEVCGLKWSGGGNLLASGGNDNLVHVWESSKMGSSRYLHRYTDHCAAVRALAWCPFRSSTLASGGGTADQCIKIWNTQTGEHEKEILSAHGYGQNQLSLWAYPSMTKIGDLTGHTARVLHLSQSPDGCTVASAAADETIRFWKVFEHQPRRGSAKLDDEGRLFSLNRTHIR